jgi:CBS domain-containing protein
VSVPISTILDRKGRHVATTTAASGLDEAVRALAEHDIGALVVLDPGDRVIGVVSERDVVRQLVATTGIEGLHVRDVMTTPVHTCAPSATVDELMAAMTERRIRHVPVVEDGALAGIVSIGDVVKWRIDELRTQTEHLEGYVTGSY